MIYVLAAIYGAAGVISLHRALPDFRLPEFLYLVGAIASIGVGAALVVQ